MHTSRFACLALALLLAAGTATAQETGIAQLREQAAKGWHQSYEACGRTVSVDIPIQLPDADRYPVLTTAYTPMLAAPVVSAWPDATVYQGTGFFRLDSHSLKSVQEMSKQYPQTAPAGMDVRPIFRSLNQLEWDTAYAYNNPSTVRDALATLQAVWADNFPDVPMAFTPYAVYATGEMRTYSAGLDASSGDPWPYQGVVMVYFHQVIDGIPVLCLAEHCFAHFREAPHREGNLVMGGTVIRQKLPDDATMYCHTLSQCTLVKTGTLLADLPLCGLDTVIQTYERLIGQGLLREVSSLRLGYAAWQTAQDSFTLIPVWALTGYLYPSAETATSVIRQDMDPRTMEYGVILVDAQTGALIDPADADTGGLFP